MKTRAAVLFFIFIVTTVYAETVDSGLTELKSKLEKDGYSTEFFIDSRFKVYNDTSGKARTLNNADYTNPRMGIFTELSFEQSLMFMDDYADTLKNAELIYKVDKEFITAILQLETNFGRKVGSRPVFNALASMYVNGRKWTFSEIKCFIDLKGTLYEDIFSIKGSYAGAFGIAQSLPSSYKHFGVDFDKDGVIDPYSMEDSIGFVANYLYKGGFRESISSRERAIYSYNRQESYVNAIIKYADELKKKQES